jgi:hypothetical protein
LKQHPDLFREYFGTVIPPEDNKFAALNSAVWSGGSFVYVPKGVKVDLPLQAYFRLNTANVGQFERTLIIVDEGASVHYVEGCTAPQYTTDSFHSGVIEIIVKKGARSRYSTIQNWSTNVYNLVTQRAKVFENGTHEWVDANLGSKVTMKYPSCYLMEPGARGEMLSMAFAGSGQHQDAGSKMIHFAPNTSSKITSKSISKAGGRASYRGLLKVYKGAKGVKSNVVCDALLLDPQSRSDTYPYIEIDEDDVTIGHEASVSKVGEEQLFYLMSRGSERRGSHHDGRLRLHRAAGQGTADGIRSRNEPPDCITDGRKHRLTWKKNQKLSFQGPDGRLCRKGFCFYRIRYSRREGSRRFIPRLGLVRFQEAFPPEYLAGSLAPHRHPQPARGQVQVRRRRRIQRPASRSRGPAPPPGRRPARWTDHPRARRREGRTG